MENQKDQLCRDLAELFGALPKTDDATTDKVRWARELILGLIGYKLDGLGVRGGVALISSHKG